MPTLVALVSSATRAKRQNRSRAAAEEKRQKLEAERALRKPTDPIPIGPLMSEADVRAAFDEIDVDRSGFLSQEEMGNALRKLGMRASGVSKLFSEITKQGSADAQHANELSFDQFYAFAKQREADLLDTFKHFDIDGSGALDAYEISVALAHSGLKGASKRKVRELIAAMDEDGDGVVSFSEFRQLALMFPSAHVDDIFHSWGSVAQVDTAVDVSYSVPASTPIVDPTKVLTTGAIAGAISRTATAPLDRIKVLRQSGWTGPAGMFKGISYLIREGGVKSLFRGNGTNVIKVMPETALKFGAFEYFKTSIARNPDSVTVPERFFAGGLAGVVAQTSVYPLEITKTRLAIAGAGTYNGIMDCMMKTLSREGVLGMYKGLAPSLLGIVPYAGVDLATYSTLKAKWLEQNPNHDPSLPVLLAMGATSSMSGQVISYPLQLVRTKLQAQGAPGHPILYRGTMDCFRKVLHSDGFSGLYKGMSANFAKAVPAISISYAAFELLKREWDKQIEPRLR